MENENLTHSEENVTLASSDDASAQEQSKHAGVSTPEDTRFAAFQSEISNKDAIITALQEQNARYAEQIAGLIRNGASVTPPEQRASSEDIAKISGQALPSDYVSLRELDLDMSDVSKLT